MTQTNRILAKLVKNETLFSACLFGLTSIIISHAFQGGLSVGHDIETHYFRIAQLVANIQEGEPFTQWARYGMRGYGYPILMFYAPLSYWLIALLDLVGFSLNVAVRLFIMGELLLAGWGLYLYTRRYFQPAGAMIAGLGYMFAPYMLYNATERGAFPELLGLALIPIILYRFDKLIDDFSIRNYLTAAFSLIIILLSHNVVPFIIFPLLGIFVAVKLFAEPWPPTIPIKKISGCVLIVLISLATTSAYWFPALTELQFTHSRLESSELMGWPQYTSHFLGLSDIVVFLEEPADPALSNRPLVRSISLAQLVLAGLAAVFLVITKTQRRPSLIAWFVVGIGSLYLLNEQSIWLWNNTPLPRYIQLPSRFLGIAGLSLAILSGFTIDQVAKYLSQSSRISVKLRSVALACLLVVVATAVSISSWPWLYPIYEDLPHQPTPLDIINSMQWNDNGAISNWGAAASGETLPQWVNELPPPYQLANEQTADPSQIQRLESHDALSIELWESRPSGDRYAIQLAEDAQLTYNTFYFPGWEVFVDGRQIETAPSEPYGFITFDLPAGPHVLDILFRPTPLRTTMWWVALLSAVILLGTTKLNLFNTDTQNQLPNHSKFTHYALPMLLAVVFLTGLHFIVNNTNNLLRANRLQPDGTLIDVSQQTNINFSQQFIHLGYSGPSQVDSSEPFEVVQYWRPQGSIGVPYGFGLRVADDDGNVWSQSEVVRPLTYTEYPGELGWRPDAYVRDPFLLTLESGIPPGEYWLEAEAFQRHVAFALRPNQNGSPADPTQARIGRITVNGTGTVNIPHNSQTEAPSSITDELDLVDWELRTGIWKPGETGAVDLIWQATEQPSQNSTAELLVQTDTGEIVSTQSFSLGNRYPMTSWEPNQAVRDKVRWVLPAQLPTGELTVSVKVGDSTTELGRVPAEAPERSFDPPQLQQQTDQVIDFAELIGYDFEHIDNRFDLKLHWQAVGETDISYRVFVHVRDQAQQVVAQSDGVPAEWTRPTTSWLTGEYITDHHKIQIPPNVTSGVYEIYIGIYNDKTGERLGELSLTETEISN